MSRGLLPISVLMACYAGDNPAWLEDAVDSVLAQTVLPSQIVLVVDGPVGDPIRVAIDRLKRRSDRIQVSLDVVPLAVNVGLGHALSRGLAACHHEFVARMDSDDLCIPDRLSRQYAFLNEHADVALVSAWHQEFEQDPDDLGSVKTTPPDHWEIARVLRWRNTISHPTILFRREAIVDAGGYQHVPLLEDWDLYLRLIAKGHKLAALQEVQVLVRTTKEQRRRRGGWRYIRVEIPFRWRHFRAGTIPLSIFLMSSFAYGAFRLMPPAAMGVAYRFVRKLPERP